MSNITNINDINEELEETVCGDNLEKVKALLSAGADVNLRLKNYWKGYVERWSLLHVTRNVEIARELLLRGADVNAKNVYRETPLHTAIAQSRSLELVKELLKHGACVRAETRKGCTALDLAIRQDPCNKILGRTQELIKYGAELTMTDCLRNLECGKTFIKFTLLRNFEKIGQIIDLTPYVESKNYKELSSYLDECVCEIIEMKKNGLPLYEFFKPHNANLRRNNELSVRLTKIDYPVNFPIYKDVILDEIQPYLERADLLNNLSKIQFYILNYDSMYNITRYLSNNDLSNLIAAFDNSNSSKFYETSDAKRLKLS